MKEKWKKWLPVGFMLVFALTRWPGLLPENFNPAYAIAFCGGVYLRNSLGWWVPMGTLLATDILLNVFHYHQPVLDAYLMLKLVAFLALIALGRRFSPRSNWIKLLGGGLLGALLFYIITNTAAWLHDPGYTKTFTGWLQALTTGLPGYPPTWTFFRNTLMSGGLFTGLFVGAMKLTEAPEPEEAREVAKESTEEAEPRPEEAKA